MPRTKSKHAKEIKKILKGISDDLERLKKLADNPEGDESVMMESVRDGVRNLLMAKKIAKKE